VTRSHATTLSAAALVAIIGGCSKSTPPEPIATAPTSIDTAPTSIDTCLAGAVERRLACEGDATCERAVSDGWAYRCYARLYDTNPGGEATMRALGPCFWEREGIRTLPDGSEQYPCANVGESCRKKLAKRVVDETCARVASSAEQGRQCRAELRYAIDDLCLRGDPALTGAGP